MTIIDKNIDSFFVSFINIAKTIAAQFGTNCEVALHDLRKPQSSLIAIFGQITKRKIGAPITNYVLSLLHKYGDNVKDSYIYESSTTDGRKLKSSTIFLRNIEGVVIGCLCINFCVDSFVKLTNIIEDFCSLEDNSEATDEYFGCDISEMVENILEIILLRHKYGVIEMERTEKLEIVKELESRGLFLVKGSVDLVAKKLKISKFTLYSYIDEVKSVKKDDREKLNYS